MRLSQYGRECLCCPELETRQRTTLDDRKDSPEREQPAVFAGRLSPCKSAHAAVLTALHWRGISHRRSWYNARAKLEDLQPNAAVRGILPDALATDVSVQWFGSEALELTYKTPAGRVANELLYRHDEPRIEVVELGRPWSFDGDGALFRLVSEAHRIRLAHLFDPVLAVHTSVVDPLPHQITAVYDAMLPRQPLRFLLADDPGAGKTIMAGPVAGVAVRALRRYRCFAPAPIRRFCPNVP